VTIYDGVVGPWFLPTFVLATDLDSVDYEVVLPSVERCVERVRTRHGHGFIDEGATREMYRQFADADIDPRHFPAIRRMTLSRQQSLCWTRFKLVGSRISHRRRELPQRLRGQPRDVVRHPRRARYSRLTKGRSASTDSSNTVRH